MIRPGIKKLFRLAFHRREDAERDVREEMRLHETSPNNPFVLGGVALVLLAVAVAASLVPAFLARRVDSMEALRAD
jgi:hypothetical protein